MSDIGFCCSNCGRNVPGQRCPICGGPFRRWLRQHRPDLILAAVLFLIVGVPIGFLVWANHADRANTIEYGEAAYHLGYEAHRAGAASQGNPYVGGHYTIYASEQWLRGWMAYKPGAEE